MIPPVEERSKRMCSFGFGKDAVDCVFKRDWGCIVNPNREDEYATFYFAILKGDHELTPCKYNLTDDELKKLINSGVIS